MSHLHYCPVCNLRWDHVDYECFSNEIPCPACDRSLTEHDEGGAERDGWVEETPGWREEQERLSAERQADGDPNNEEVE